MLKDSDLFDYSQAMHEVIADISECLPEFRHIQPDRIWIAVSQCRKRGIHGTYASVLPLRFRDGARETVRHGIRYTRRPVFDGEKEILYIITFYLPRFCDLPFERKLKTIFHELYHISPDFNGDIRRLGGRKFAHGSSRKEFDERFHLLMQRYLSARRENAELLEFLRLDFASLVRKHGQIVGRRIRSRRGSDPAADNPKRHRS